VQRWHISAFFWVFLGYFDFPDRFSLVDQKWCGVWKIFEKMAVTTIFGSFSVHGGSTLSDFGDAWWFDLERRKLRETMATWPIGDEHCDLADFSKKLGYGRGASILGRFGRFSSHTPPPHTHTHPPHMCTSSPHSHTHTIAFGSKWSTLSVFLQKVLLFFGHGFSPIRLDGGNGEKCLRWIFAKNPNFVSRSTRNTAALTYKWRAKPRWTTLKIAFQDYFELKTNPERNASAGSWIPQWAQLIYGIIIPKTVWKNLFTRLWSKRGRIDPKWSHKCTPILGHFEVLSIFSYFLLSTDFSKRSSA